MSYLPLTPKRLVVQRGQYPTTRAAYGHKPVQARYITPVAGSSPPRKPRKVVGTQIFSSVTNLRTDMGLARHHRRPSRLAVLTHRGSRPPQADPFTCQFLVADRVSAELRSLLPAAGDPQQRGLQALVTAHRALRQDHEVPRWLRAACRRTRPPRARRLAATELIKAGASDQEVARHFRVSRMSAN
jgi:hypothetical protein